MHTNFPWLLEVYHIRLHHLQGQMWLMQQLPHLSNLVDILQVQKSMVHIRTVYVKPLHLREYEQGPMLVIDIGHQHFHVLGTRLIKVYWY